MLRSNRFDYGYNQQFLFYAYPPECDNWGFTEDGEQFKSSICVMDDFGNAIAVPGFAHQFEGYMEFMGPDMDPQTPEGQPYKYIMYYPTIH